MIIFPFPHWVFSYSNIRFLSPVFISSSLSSFLTSFPLSPSTLLSRFPSLSFSVSFSLADPDPQNSKLTQFCTRKEATEIRHPKAEGRTVLSFVNKSGAAFAGGWNGREGARGTPSGAEGDVKEREVRSTLHRGRGGEKEVIRGVSVDASQYLLQGCPGQTRLLRTKDHPCKEAGSPPVQTWGGHCAFIKKFSWPGRSGTSYSTVLALGRRTLLSCTLLILWKSFRCSVKWKAELEDDIYSEHVAVRWSGFTRMKKIERDFQVFKG